MTDSDPPRGRQPDELPGVGEPAEPERGGPMNTIRGADSGALGIGDTQRTDPPQADAAPSRPSPPASFASGPEELREEKPWFTSLAAGSHQAGVANDAPEPVDPALSPEQAIVEENEEAS